MKEHQLRCPPDATKQSVSVIKANLKRLETVLKSPYVRPADYTTRDWLARKLRDAKKLRA